MPAETKEATRTFTGRRWMTSVLKAAAEPLPALPFERGNRSRPASLATVDTVRKGIAAH